jgi:hypothetical protein
MHQRRRLRERRWGRKFGRKNGEKRVHRTYNVEIREKDIGPTMLK